MYKNPDFTNFHASRTIQAEAGNENGGGINIVCDHLFDEEFFKNETIQMSMVLLGGFRVENTTVYNFTVESNFKFRIYFDDELVLEKNDI